MYMMMAAPPPRRLKLNTKISNLKMSHVHPWNRASFKKFRIRSHRVHTSMATWTPCMAKGRLVRGFRSFYFMISSCRSRMNYSKIMLQYCRPPSRGDLKAKRGHQNKQMLHIIQRFIHRSYPRGCECMSSLAIIPM
jgi:hypothetical protein